MPFCPSCRCEYLPHITICPECNVYLVEVLPPDGPPQAPTQSVEVFETENHFELTLARGMLEENGIECILGERENDPFRLSPPAWRIRVPEADAVRARELLEIYLRQDEMKFICESCGAELSELPETCPRCGKSPTS